MRCYTRQHDVGRCSGKITVIIESQRLQIAEYSAKDSQVCFYWIQRYSSAVKMLTLFVLMMRCLSEINEMNQASAGTRTILSGSLLPEGIMLEIMCAAKKSMESFSILFERHPDVLAASTCTNKGIVIWQWIRA